MDEIFTIGRQQTSEEKKNFKSLLEDTPTLRETFTQKLIEAQQKATKEHIPFCASCAKIDFNDWAEQQAKEMDRVIGFTDFTKLKSNIPNLGDYSKIDRFVNLGEQLISEP